MIGNSSDKLHDISRYTKMNTNTPHDAIVDVIKPNGACLLNIVQRIFFINSLSVSMLKWKYISIFLASL